MYDTPKYSMFAVEMWGWAIANEEGGSISIRSGISHRQYTFVCMGHPDMFICKLGPIGALRLNSIIINHNFAALHHEARNNSLKDSMFVVHIQS